MCKQFIYLVFTIVAIALSIGPSLAHGDEALIGWWKLDENTGTIAYDSSNGGNNGTLIGNPVWQPSSGAIGGALEFNGKDDFVKIDNEPAFGEQAVFLDGSVWHTIILPVGGNHLTHDIAVGLRTPFTVAETLKTQYGHGIPDSIQPEDVIDATSFGDNSHRSVSRAKLAEIIRARMEEILELTMREIKRSGYDGLLPAGIVLCGGTAELAGVKQLAREALGLPVRVGTPRGLEGLVESVRDPAHACSVGLLLWATRYAPDVSRNGSGSGRGAMWRLRHLLGALTPG